MLGKIKAWLNKKRTQRQRQQYLEKYYVNLCCAACGGWSSDSVRPPAISSFGHPVAVAYECGSCGHVSFWVCEAGFWLRSEDFGVSRSECEALLSKGTQP